MARLLFGGSSDDQATDSLGRPVPNRRVRFYTSAARTTEITDLASDAAGTGAPLTVTTDSHGYWGPVYGPDAVTVMYAATVDADGNPPTYVVAVYTHSSSAAGAENVVVHGATAGTARPAGATVVHWIGSVAPTNVSTNDEWTDTTNKILKRWNGSSFDSLGSAASSVAWQPAITTNTTATKGNGYPVNCTGGAVSLTLPASPAVGDQVGFYKTDASTNALTVVGTVNGQTNAVVTTQNAGATVIYQGGSVGWLADLYGGVSAVTTVQDEGTPLTQRPIIDFVGAGVTAADDAANNRTTVTIPGGGGSGGGILAQSSYAPASHTYTLTTSRADVDATNLKVTFTAPTSGSVLVSLSGDVDTSASGSATWGLSSGGSQVGTDRQIAFNQTSSSRRMAWFPVTGLTSGTSYTFTWVQYGSSATHLYVAPTDPADMIVFSA